MSSSGGYSLPFVGKSGFLVGNVLCPLKHDVLFILAFAVAVRCIAVPCEGKTSGETNPKSSDFIYFYLPVLFYFISLPLDVDNDPCMMIMKVCDRDYDFFG